MKLQLSAIDTWFFRDGTPFGMNSSSQSGVVGMFPPFPPTVAGAIRAALARRNGWDGRTRWNGELATILGDGPADLGRLRLTGPCVLRHGTPLFPMPRHVAGRIEAGGEWIPVALMRPAREHVPSDLGPSVRLPALEHTPAASPPSSLEVGAKQWVTLEGLQQILRGQLPLAEEIVPERALWAGESRIGIRRAPDSRTVTVTEGALYSTRHTRPAAGVSLGIEVDGVPVSWHRPEDDVIPLGGEGRLAACEVWDTKTKLDFDSPARDAHNAVIVALTPVLLGRKGSELAFPGARIVSACTERPLRIGGWDSEARTPLPLRNAAPPGSTWFCELDDASAFWAAISNGLLRAGEATATGFGLCAVGGAQRWEKTT